MKSSLFVTAHTAVDTKGVITQNDIRTEISKNVYKTKMIRSVSEKHEENKTEKVKARRRVERTVAFDMDSKFPAIAETARALWEGYTGE